MNHARRGSLLTIRRRKRFPLIIIFYLLLLTSVGFLIRGNVRYAGVEEWPYVKAYDVIEVGHVSNTPIQTRTGSREMLIDTRKVRFRYNVNGVEYQGTRSRPDGGPLPIKIGDSEWRAYYKPNDPEIAVLSPVPYQGTLWVVTASLSLLVVVVHLIFHVRGS